MLPKWISTAFLVLITANLMAQFTQKKTKLSKELNEISGLEQLNDSVLIAINDGGNDPLIYFLNFAGKILKTCRVTNAVNSDWEDLAMDEKRNLYIADVGNNMNHRNDLCVLKVNADDAFKQEEIQVESIRFTYKYQENFSPNKHLRAYDCEALYWFKDTLRLLTKITSKPTKNKECNGTFEYPLSLLDSTHVLIPRMNYWTGGSNRLKHQVTACDEREGILAILTYGNIYFYKTESPENRHYKSIKFKRLTQKESVVIITEKKIIVAAERNILLGGPYLYTIILE